MADQVTQVQPGSSGEGTGVGSGIMIGIVIVILLVIFAIFFLPGLRNQGTTNTAPSNNPSASGAAGQYNVNVQGQVPQTSP